MCDLPHCLVGIEACPSAHHFGRLASGGARRNSFYPLEWGICFSKGLPRSIADNARRLIEGVLSPQQHPIARYGDGSCRYSSRCASVRVVLPRSPPARVARPGRLAKKIATALAIQCLMSPPRGIRRYPSASFPTTWAHGAAQSPSSGFQSRAAVQMSP